jgi:hypothetical protein
MDRRQKWTLLGVVSVAIVSLAITAVTASPRTLGTPLYTFRMEKASGEMNFSPATMNNLTYTTGNGWRLNHDVSGEWFGALPLIPCTWNDGCSPTTGTCDRTCKYTCSSTCVSTCSTCVNTCPNTCVNTCPNTCVSTCSTCVSTCSNTCISSCNGTCGAYTCDTCYHSCVPDQ